MDQIFLEMILLAWLAQQPQGVGDDDEAGAHIGGDGHPEVGQAEDGQDQDDGLGHQGQGDVLADAGESVPGCGGSAREAGRGRRP